MNRLFAYICNVRPGRGLTIRYLCAPLVASMSVTGPALQPENRPGISAEILQIQAHVARSIPGAAGPEPDALADVLDLQRSIAGQAAGEPSHEPEPVPSYWAAAPASLRADSLAANPLARTPERPAVQTSRARPHCVSLPPPLAPRTTERYRMRLTAHAPPWSAESHTSTR